MTRERLMEIATAHGLALSVDRITTAGKSGGFHTFEFAGPDVAKMNLAAHAIRAEWGVRLDLCRVDLVTNPGHEDYGKPFLNVTSFWC